MTMSASKGTLPETELASEATTTRQQLQGYGASAYLARRLTRSLKPVGKDGNAFVYSLRQVVSAIRQYAEQPNVRATTKETLSRILPELLARLDNVVEMMPKAESSLGQLAQEAIKAMRRTDKSLARMKATVASLSSSGSED